MSFIKAVLLTLLLGIDPAASNNSTVTQENAESISNLSHDPCIGLEVLGDDLSKFTDISLQGIENNYLACKNQKITELRIKNNQRQYFNNKNENLMVEILQKRQQASFKDIIDNILRRIKGSKTKQDEIKELVKKMVRFNDKNANAYKEKNEIEAEIESITNKLIKLQIAKAPRCNKPKTIMELSQNPFSQYKFNYQDAFNMYSDIRMLIKDGTINPTQAENEIWKRMFTSLWLCNDCQEQHYYAWLLAKHIAQQLDENTQGK